MRPFLQTTPSLTTLFLPAAAVFTQGRNTPGLYDRERIKGRPPELRRNWPVRTHFTLSYTPRPYSVPPARVSV